MLKPIFCVLIATASVIASAESSKEQQAKDLAKKAVIVVKKEGIDAACKKFVDPAGGFIQGELFVYVHDIRAKMICHAANPRLNGKDMIEMKDTDGKYFNKEMVKIATSTGNGWVNYQFVNPVTKKIQPKSSYVERVDDYIVGVGYFKE